MTRLLNDERAHFEQKCGADKIYMKQEAKYDNCNKNKNYKMKK